MGNKTKLYTRGICLLIFTSFIASDYFFKTKFIAFIFNYKFLHLISVMNIFFIYLFFEMLVVIIPKFNNHSYNGKHFIKHYKPVKNYDTEKLKQFTKQNQWRTIRSALFWFAFNIPLYILFFRGLLSPLFFYWLFFLYYFFDYVCINIFCIFHLFITRNKCCNECRIYNWSYIMYCTPLILIPNIWNYTLTLLAVIILVQWEYGANTHPERFSSVSNQNLKCGFCGYDCRYRKYNKEDFVIEILNKIKEHV